ncbi:hypothetical protein KSS87_008163, partial [Heliosperma pusillum]
NDLRVVSDANFFFIETILNHLGLREYFSEINMNPSFVDEEGKLRILPHHDFTKSSHGCNLCPPNMCKSHAIKRILSEEEKKKIMYLGDGKGDYCASLKLRKGDHMMPRKNRPVWDLIKESPGLTNTDIHEWFDGEDLEQVLLSTIQDISCKGDANATTMAQIFENTDCKLEIMPTLPHEAFPKVKPF